MREFRFLIAPLTIYLAYTIACIVAGEALLPMKLKYIALEEVPYIRFSSVAPFAIMVGYLLSQFVTLAVHFIDKVVLCVTKGKHGFFFMNIREKINKLKNLSLNTKLDWNWNKYNRDLWYKFHNYNKSDQLKEWSDRRWSIFWTNISSAMGLFFVMWFVSKYDINDKIPPVYYLSLKGVGIILLINAIVAWRDAVNVENLWFNNN